MLSQSTIVMCARRVTQAHRRRAPVMWDPVANAAAELRLARENTRPEIQMSAGAYDPFSVLHIGCCRMSTSLAIEAMEAASACSRGERRCQRTSDRTHLSPLVAKRLQSLLGHPPVAEASRKKERSGYDESTLLIGVDGYIDEKAVACFPGVFIPIAVGELKRSDRLTESIRRVVLGRDVPLLSGAVRSACRGGLFDVVVSDVAALPLSSSVPGGRTRMLLAGASPSLSKDLRVVNDDHSELAPVSLPSPIPMMERDPTIASIAAGIAVLRRHGSMIARFRVRRKQANGGDEYVHDRETVAKGLRDLRIHFARVDIWPVAHGIVAVGRRFTPEQSSLTMPLDSLDNSPHHGVTNERRKESAVPKSAAAVYLTLGARQKKKHRLVGKRASVHDARRKYFRALQPASLSGAAHPELANQIARAKARDEVKFEEVDAAYSDMVSSILDVK